MGGEDELQTSTCDFKKHQSSSKKLLSYCGGVSYDSVPRKLRSAIKKRGHECISPSLLVSRKQRCILNGVEKLRKSRPKKSGQMTKNGHVTKDEEEVAETLFALADMFKTSNPVPDEEPLLDVGSFAKDAESKKTDTRIIFGDASDYWRLVNPTAQVVQSQSSGDAEQPKLETSTTEIQSYFSRSPRFLTWSGKTYRATQPNVTENSFAADKIHYPQAVLELKKTWKRCPTHIHITRLIKLLQKSETSKELLQKPTCEGFEHSLYLNIGQQKRGVNEFFTRVPDKYIDYDAIARFSEKMLRQDSGAAFVGSSHKQVSDLSSLTAGGNGSNSMECTNRARYSTDALKQVDGPYQHPQNLPGMLFSFQNSGDSTSGNHTSAEAAMLQVQIPPYRGNTIMAPFGHGTEFQQQKRCAATPHIQDWQDEGGDSTSWLKNVQALFPSMHSTLDSKDQHKTSPPQAATSLELPNVGRHCHNLNPALNRNGATLYDTQQLQLLCNQRY